MYRKPRGNAGEDDLSLRERNKQRTRERIIGAATELFQSLGYDQATIDSIADKARVSRGTLFNYFPTKDALLLPFARQVFQTRVQPALSAYLQTNPSTLEALRFLFTNIHKHVLTIPEIDRAFKQQFLQPRDPDVIPDGDQMLDSLLAILSHGQARGEVRTDIPLEQQAHYIGALYLTLFFSMIMQFELTDYQVEVDRLLAFILSGLQA